MPFIATLYSVKAPFLSQGGANRLETGSAGPVHHATHGRVASGPSHLRLLQRSFFESIEMPGFSFPTMP